MAENTILLMTRGGLVFITSTALIFGLIFSLIGGQNGDLVYFTTGLLLALLLALPLGLPAMLLGGLSGLLDASKIVLRESLTRQYSRDHIWDVIKTKIQQGVIFGVILWLILLVMMLIFMQIDEITISQSETLSSAWSLLIYALFFGLISGLVGGLSEGIIGEAQSNDLKKTTPNQGIWLSGRNGLLMGFVGMVRDVIVFGVFFSLSYGFSNGDFVSGALFGGILGAPIGFLGGFWDYGLAVVQHYIVRWLLRNKLPYPLHDKKLAAYLDGMVERLLLRRVYSGWHFIHLELQEYVAGLSDEQLDELAASLSPTAT